MSIKYMVIDILSKGPASGLPECDIIAYDIDDIQQAEKIRVEYLKEEVSAIPVEEYDNIKVVMYKE